MRLKTSAVPPRTAPNIAAFPQGPKSEGARSGSGPVPTHATDTGRSTRPTDTLDGAHEQGRHLYAVAYLLGHHAYLPGIARAHFRATCRQVRQALEPPSSANSDKGLDVLLQASSSGPLATCIGISRWMKLMTSGGAQAAAAQAVGFHSHAIGYLGQALMAPGAHNDVVKLQAIRGLVALLDGARPALDDGQQSRICGMIAKTFDPPEVSAYLVHNTLDVLTRLGRQECDGLAGDIARRHPGQFCSVWAMDVAREGGEGMTPTARAARERGELFRALSAPAQIVVDGVRVPSHQTTAMWRHIISSIEPHALALIDSPITPTELERCLEALKADTIRFFPQLLERSTESRALNERIAWAKKEENYHISGRQVACYRLYEAVKGRVAPLLTLGDDTYIHLIQHSLEEDMQRDLSQPDQLLTNRDKSFDLSYVTYNLLEELF